MKTLKTSISIFISIVLAASIALAAPMLSRVWADPVLFRAHIEQPTGTNNARLILDVNGIENPTDLSDGETAIPILSGNMTRLPGALWIDENGKHAASTPIMTLRTADGQPLDEKIFVRIKVDPVPGTALSEIAEVLRFSIWARVYEPGSGEYAECGVDNDEILVDVVDGYAISAAYPIARLQQNQRIELTVAAYAVDVADGDFNISIEIATG